MKEAQAVADVLRCSVMDLQRVSGRDYERALSVARADYIVDRQREKDREFKRNNG